MRLNKTALFLTMLLMALIAAWLPSAGGTVRAQDRSSVHAAPAMKKDPAFTGWDYAWEKTEAPDGAMDGWKRLPADGWKAADRLLNPEGREADGILWLRTVLPAGSGEAGSLLLQASQLFEVYVDGSLVYVHGALPPSGSPHYIGTPPRIVPLPDTSDGNMLHVRVYSHGADIGLIGKPEVSTRQAIQLELIRSQSVRFILGCFYVLVGLLALYPYVKLKQVHLLSFAGFSAGFGLYQGTRTTLIYMIWDAPMFWMTVELTSLMLSLASVIAFTGHLFGHGWKDHLKRVAQLHLLFACLTIPLVLLHAMQADHILRVYQILILASMGAGINRIARTAWQGERDARTVLTGMLALCLCGAVDIFRQMLAVESEFPELAYWGAFIFLVSLIIVIIRRLVFMLARLSNTEKLSVAGQLAAGVAHEIRNPITVISGYLQLMKRTETNTKMIDIMQGEVNRIRLIMNEFLFLAKPSEPKMGRHRLENIVRDVLQLFRAQAKTLGVSIHFRCPPGFPEVSCDDNQLKQVLVNVIKNALEAMTGGGSLSIEIGQRGGNAVLTFMDNGCGIPAAVMAKIGEPFFTTKETGNGLGIMICRSIMENHRGSFSIDSAADVGTTVTVKLPLTGK